MDDKQEPNGGGKRTLTDAQKKARQERESLQLARARVLQQLESATNDRYVQSLRQALNELDEKIGKIGS
jgi:hypothetical protein